MSMSPMDMLNSIRSKAKLEELDYGNIIAIKLNKPGKIKMQLLALDSENLFKPRTQHFIQNVPDNDDPNEKVMVIDCQGKNCPICSAANAFKASGITVDMLNEAYKSKYPYRNLRSFLTMPEHFIVYAKIIQDSAEEGKYLPKDAELGSAHFVQLSRSALNSLMESYEDFIDDALDNDEDIDSMPPLFGVFEDGAKEVSSLVVNCRVSVQPYSYNFSFGKASKTSLDDIDMDKLEKLSDGPLAPTDDYLEKALQRIKNIQNYFVGGPQATTKDKFSMIEDEDDDLGINSSDDEFDIDSL